VKIKTWLTTTAFLIIVSASGQKVTLDLTFTAIDNAAWVRLDSIKVMNRTQGGDTVLYWPDTTLTYEITPGDLLLYIGYAMGYPVGVQSIGNRVTQFQLFQGYPNPVWDQAVITMSLPSNGTVNITVADIRGRVALNFNRELQKGTHSFIFHPGDERIYIFTTRWNGITQSIKILTEGVVSGKTCRLEYTGIKNGNPVLKQSPATMDLVVQESGILDSPTINETYTFQFATNISCPGTPTVEYEGQVYNTIQVRSQCWLKENLNVGIMINGTQNQTNNSIKEKYCYDNQPDSCTKYGGLYQWDEMMQYTTQQGVQGICPPGWHLPTDEEWKVLEGAADSQYGIGDPEWDLSEYRGYDAGTNLKTTSSWYQNGNGTDLFGFSGLPGGYGDIGGTFYSIGYDGYWWTSTEDYYYWAWYRNLDCDRPEVYRFDLIGGKELGFSVRCLRD
jgi:uncharacterized protein (TIGR02145 family)